MTGTIPPGTAVLWHGTAEFLDTNKPYFTAATDMGGDVLITLEGPDFPPTLGIAFDGTNLWFSNQFQVASNPEVRNSEIEKRTADGNIIQETLFPKLGKDHIHTTDIAFDTKRGHLWQMDYGQLAAPPTPEGAILPAKIPIAPTLTRIDLANPGTKTKPADTLRTIDLAAPKGCELGGGYGVTYDSDNDLLYFSFSNMMDAQNITLGVVMAMMPEPNPTPEHPDNTDFLGGRDFVKEVFRRSAEPHERSFGIFGLGFQPGAGTLNGKGTIWAGGFGEVRHYTLDTPGIEPGTELAKVRSPAGTPLDGLEFVGGSCP